MTPPGKQLHTLHGDELIWALDERNQKRWHRLERNQYLTWIIIAGLFGGTAFVMRLVGLS